MCLYLVNFFGGICLNLYFCKDLNKLMGAQSSSLAEPNPEFAGQQKTNILALWNRPPNDPKRLAALKDAGTYLTAIQARLDNVSKNMAKSFDDFANTSQYLNTIFEDVRVACIMNKQHMPFTTFFTLEPDIAAKEHVAKTLFTPFCRVILLRYLVYKQWIGTFETLMEVEEAFQRVAQTGFAPNAAEFAVLQRIATLEPLENKFTLSLDMLKPYFVFTDQFPEINILAIATGTSEVVLAWYAPSEQSVHAYLNYLVQHWKRLESLDGFLDNSSKFFASLHKSQATAIQEESTLRRSISAALAKQQTLRLTTAETLPAPLPPPIQGAPRVLVVLAATHGSYLTRREGGKIKIATATVPYNMTLTKVPLVQPGLTSYQGFEQRRAQLALFEELKLRLNPTPPSLRDVLAQVQDTTQQYATNVREVHTQRVEERVTQYNPGIEAQLYSEKLYPMTYLPCKKYLNKTFGVTPEDTADPNVDYKLVTLNYDGDGSTDLLQLLGTKLESEEVYTHLNEIMHYAKQLRVQHVILIDLTCATLEVAAKGADVALLPSEIQEVAQKRLGKFQLGGGNRNVHFRAPSGGYKIHFKR